MLTLYRRHLDECPHRDDGRAWTKCSCPIHCDGRIKGKRVPESMETVNWDRARRRMAELEEELAGGKVRKAVAEATELFLCARTMEPSTGRKYRRIMERLKTFAAGSGLATVDAIGLEHLDEY